MTGCVYDIFGYIFFNRHLDVSTTIQRADQGGMCNIGKSANKLDAHI